jgi:dienelactone hydrolase
MKVQSTDAELELLIHYPSATEPLESGYGDVAPGQWPVVLFGHANSYTECRLVDAYQSLQEQWASWGYIVLSVDASPHCEKNSKANLEARRDDLMAAWGSLESMSRDTDSPLHGRVDTESLVLAGHSRGASAALLASTWLPESDGLIWIQGVDTAGYHLGHPSVRVPSLGLVAEKDRDIRFPKAEPTRDQLDASHAWVTLKGGIHAYSSDRIPPKDKDQPGLERSEQIALSAHLSTLLLASTLGVSDGAQMVPLPEAEEFLFGPELPSLSSSIHAIWGRSSHDILWLEDFQRDSDTNMLGAINHAEPADSAQRTFAWKAGAEDPGRILGDSHALLLTASPQAHFTVEPGIDGIPIPRGARLVFLVKDLEGTLRVHIDTSTGRNSHVITLDPELESRRYQQVELALTTLSGTGAVESIHASQIVFELTEGRVMLDDIRLAFP